MGDVQDFFHRQLQSGQSELPKIFGMTASPIKSKGICLYIVFISYLLLDACIFYLKIVCSFGIGGNPELNYWKTIDELETLMNSKVYTCVDESVLSEFIPTSTPKFRTYRRGEIPSALYTCLTNQLIGLKEKVCIICNGI